MRLRRQVAGMRLNSDGCGCICDVGAKFWKIKAGVK